MSAICGPWRCPGSFIVSVDGGSGSGTSDVLSGDVWMSIQEIRSPCLGE